MPPETPSEQPEKWDEIGEQIFKGLATGFFKSEVTKTFTATIGDAVGALVGAAVTLLAPIGIGMAKGIAKSEDLVAPALAEMTAAAVNDMFNSNVPASAFEAGIIHGKRLGASEALAAGLIKQLVGDVSTLEPSGAAADRYVGFMMNMALEGWYQKWFFEFLTSLIPQLDIGKIENFGSLDDKMTQALGLGRLCRRVLSVIVDATIVTPLKWQTNKTYRPNLLSEAMAVRLYLGGQWSHEKLTEELARQGWSDDRIEAQISDKYKFLSLDDMLFLVREGRWPLSQVTATLRTQGYDEGTAQYAVTAATVKRIAAWRDDSLAAVKRAYVDREISQSEFSTLLHAIVYDADERSAVEVATQTVREMNVKHLTHAEVKNAVHVGILAMIDYRRWLEREGYAGDDALTLELLLRAELDKDAKVEDLRARAKAERAAEKAKRDQAAAARKAQVDADRALHRRGSLADLERAVVRGIVPITRYAELLAPQYDADTAQILVTLLEDKRLDYLDQQQRAADARKRAAVRNIDVGALEQAVLTGVLTMEEFAGRLGQLGFPMDDADILTATLHQKMLDAAAAAATRAAAKAAAAMRSIDLGRYERLVVHGARTFAQYDQVLASLGFDDASRAAMAELLQLEIADAAEARRLRDAAAAARLVKGVTLEQMRRAVVLGTKTEADYQTYLLANGYTTEAVTVLLAEVRADVADAIDARDRRAAADAARDVRAIPLATVARAARLGLILPGVYQRRLEADGYSPEDVDIDMSLLTFEIADVQAKRAAAAAPPPLPGAKGVSLSELARAVKSGVRTIGEYQARAIELGYDQADVETLVGVLTSELETLADAQRRRDEIAAAPARDVSVSQLEAAVKAGLLTLDAYVAQLGTLGYSEDAAALLAALLESKL